MADVVGVDHVGFGSDMLGLTVPSVFDSYRELPQLAQGRYDLQVLKAGGTGIISGNESYALAWTMYSDLLTAKA